MAASPVGFLRLEEVATMPDTSIQAYLDSKGHKSRGKNNDLISAIIFYHNDNLLINMDSQVVKHPDFMSTMTLTQEALITKVSAKGVEVTAIMTKYDLIRILLLSQNFLSDYLVEASRHGQQEKVNKILLLGANTLVKNDYNEAMNAAAEGDHREIVQMMLDSGADDYNDAMEVAASGGYQKIIQMLIAHGGERITIRNYTQAMVRAAQYGHQEIVKMMLNKGVTSTAAMAEAARGGHRKIVKMMLDQWREKLTIYDYSIVMKEAARGGHRKI